jgi:hypothetical protein
MAHDVFICYSARDKTTADAVCAVLESEGVRCWIAPRDILPGADWGESIIDAINDARALVLIFSANANAAQSQIKREVERAVNKGIVVIPFRIEDVVPTKSLEYFLSTPHWLDAFTPPLDGHIRSLAASIKCLLDKQADAPAAPAAPRAPVAPPYVPPPHHAVALSELRIGGVPVLEWVKQPLHMGMIAAAVGIVILGAWLIFRPTATPDDQAVWDVAAAEDTISAYQLYMRERPDGYYHDRAESRMADIRAEVDEAWAKARAAGTAAAYKSFLDNYSKQGLDIDEARDALANADVSESAARSAYRRAIATRTRDGYQAFLAQYGTSVYASDARQRLAACHSETKPSSETKSSELERGAVGSGSTSDVACAAARNSAVSRIESACADAQGQMGAVRVISLTPQEDQSPGGQIGSLLGSSLFGHHVNLGGLVKCTAEVEVSCGKTITQMRTVDVCP